MDTLVKRNLKRERARCTEVALIEVGQREDLKNRGEYGGPGLLPFVASDLALQLFDIEPKPNKHKRDGD